MSELYTGSTKGSTIQLPSNVTVIDNTQNTTSTFVTNKDFSMEEIAANDIMSRANYVYSFLAGLGFVAACFLLYTFTLTFRAQRRVAWLDCLLWAFCGLQLLLILLSLYAVAHRPDYLKTTVLGCATISFTINTIFVSSLFVLALLAYVLSLDPPSHALLRKPGVCAAIVILASVLIALILAVIGKPEEDKCFMDSVCLPYAVAKLFLAFLVPYILQLALLIGGCVRQWKTNGRFLSGSEEGLVFMTVTATMFFCELFYCVALVRAAQVRNEAELSHREKAFLSVSEFVFFSGSSISLILVLFLHRPCRETLKEVIRQMRDCCQRPGQAQPNRNIITPQIEITDTLQDMES